MLVLLIGEFMKYAVEMGSGAMIYIPSFKNIGSGIQKLIMGGYTCRHTDPHRQHGELLSLLLLFSKYGKYHTWENSK
jgi:hypothetical protein